MGRLRHQDPEVYAALKYLQTGELIKIIDTVLPINIVEALWDQNLL